MTTATATLPQATELVSAMEEINAAEGCKDFFAANAKAVALGLRLRRGFYGQRRSIHPERIELVRSASSETELREILQDINYDELML